MKLGPRPERLLSVGSIVADIRVDVPYLPPRGGDVLASTASIPLPTTSGLQPSLRKWATATF